ncbi:MAG: hypothetical protein K1X92_00330 [Bacteroidia bacterium]|nr:hypothetical protein [Bacteroidia bacterium]
MKIRFYIIFLLCFFLSGIQFVYAQKKGAPSTPPDSLKNTPLTVSDSLKKDSVIVGTDRKSVITDSLKNISELKTPIKSRAEDSIVFDIEKKILYMYGSAGMDYEDLKIESDRITVDWTSQLMTAEGTPYPDSSGNIKGKPVFTQGEQNYTARKMSYNFKTKKGKVTEARTSEGEGFLLAEAVKRNPDNSYFGLNGKYTTCNEPEHPHFYIKSKKMKVIPDDKIISGPLNLVIEEFPLPIIVPFGFVPNVKKKTTGIVMPTYGVQGERGIYLQNLGYYIGKSEYFNLLLDGDIYSKGGWRLGAGSQYKYQSRLSGNIAMDYGIIQFNEATDPDFRKTVAWKFNWTHQQTINQNTNLSARVTLDKQFNRNLNFNMNQALANLQTSSVTLSKSRIANTPFSFYLSSELTQNINKNTITMRLPNFTFSMAPQTPFKNVGVKYDGLKFLRQLNFNYSLNATNQVTDVLQDIAFEIIQNPNKRYTYTQENPLDTISKMGYEFFSNGIRHSIPLSTKIQLFKYLNISPSMSYNEYWYTKTIEKSYDTLNRQVMNTTLNGFATARDFNTSVNANTTLYAFYGLKKSKRNFVVRQLFIPSIGYTYRPDFSEKQWGFYKTYTGQDNREFTYSRFEGSIVGGPGSGESQSLNFSLQSNLEAKLLKKESFKPDFPEKEDKYDRIRLLDNLGLSTSYNFAADSFNLAGISLNGRTTLFKNKLNINANATLDPYYFNDSLGRRVNEFAYRVNNTPGRLTNAGISFNTAFQSKNKRKRPVKKSPGFDEAEYADIQRFMAGYVDFNIPWSLSLTYNLTYINSGNLDPVLNNVLNFRSDFNLTEKWKIGLNSGYDFTNNQIAENTSFSLYRDLHCWEMSFNWNPLGRFQSYFLTINVKSSTLQDLKLNKKNLWTNRFRDF